MFDFLALVLRERKWIANQTNKYWFIIPITASVAKQAVGCLQDHCWSFRGRHIQCPDWTIRHAGCMPNGIARTAARSHYLGRFFCLECKFFVRHNNWVSDPKYKYRLFPSKWSLNFGSKWYHRNRTSVMRQVGMPISAPYRHHIPGIQQKQRHKPLCYPYIFQGSILYFDIIYS